MEYIDRSEEDFEVNHKVLPLQHFQIYKHPYSGIAFYMFIFMSNFSLLVFVGKKKSYNSRVDFKSLYSLLVMRDVSPTCSLPFLICMHIIAHELYEKSQANNLITVLYSHVVQCDYNDDIIQNFD